MPCDRFPLLNDDSAQPLISALLTSLAEHHTRLKGRRIWLACSGGRDSLSLAALCHQLYWAGKLPILPQLLHVNHGLQAANDEWALKVKQWAAQRQIPCQVLTVQVLGDNEQAARQARYEAMASIMNIGDVLLLGHHSDDQAETVLLRLFNGAGVTGLGGMRAWSDKQMTKKIHLWRPWLLVSRQQITQFADAIGLGYVDDPTNLMTASLSGGNDRAWLRSVMMPQIQARFAQANTSIARSAQLLQQASETISAQAHIDIQHCQQPRASMFGSAAHQLQVSAPIDAWQSTLSIQALLALPYARQAAAIHHWLTPTLTDLPPPQRLVADVLSLCQRIDSNHQSCLYWHSGHKSYEIRRYQQQLFRLDSRWLEWLAQPILTQQICPTDKIGPISKISLTSHANQDSLKDTSIKTADNVDWRLLYLSQLMTALVSSVELNSLSQTLPSDSVKEHPAAYCLQLQALPRQWAVTLAGRLGRKSGKKLFQDLRLPSFMRESVALLSLVDVSQSFEDTDGQCPRSSLDASDCCQIPLCLLSMAGAHVIESPYTMIVETWLRAYGPVMQLLPNQSS
ncbi:MAG: tRNA lysidine(34) synthetase TilS [Psychrobacter sp.]|nr:tRNA lysidine(34) synthetase TilS [Psychrobacter sp.]